MMLVLFCFATVFVTASGYEHGAPYSSCISQYPQHDAAPQTGPSPYSVLVSTTSYSPGAKIQVAISGPEFTGFSISARRIKGDIEQLVGTFTDHPAAHAQTYNCLGGDKNFVTHTSSNSKVNTTFTWTMASETAGDIIFRATVLKTDTVFWTWITSNHVIDSTSSGKPGSLQQVENSFPTMDLEKECGKTKGCFLSPRSCRGSDCTSAVSYQREGDVIHFQMMGVAPGYVSVGFSKDAYMGDDSVVACTVEDSQVSIQHGFNAGYHYLRQYSNKLTNMATAKKDGKIYCKFTRPLSLTSVTVDEDEERALTPHEITVDLTNGSILFVAIGKTFAGGNVLSIHDETPVRTDAMVDFGQFVVQRGTSLSTLTQIHGILMILAWMLCVSLATVGGRYFRQGFGSQKIGGLLLWFQMHRAFTMTAGGLTAAGFIIIFIKVKGMSSGGALYHAYVGISVMAAVCAQIFLGVMRPNGTSKNRLAFNWAHRFLGKATHILAAVDLILAFRITQLSPAVRHFGTIVVAVWISVQAVWEFSLELNKFLETERLKEDPQISSSQMKLEEKEVPKKPNSRLLLVLFVLYVMTIIACTVAALCALIVV